MKSSDELPADPALSRLYRQTEPVLPAASVDAAVLDAARRALATPAPASWWKRLRVPVSVAATVVLGVMLSLTMERQPVETPVTPVVEEQAPAPVETRSALPPLPASAPANLAGRKSAPPPVAERDVRQEKKALPATAAREAASSPFPGAPLPAAPEPAVQKPAVQGRAPIADSALRSEGAGVTAGSEPSRAPAPKARAMLPAPEAWLEEIRRLHREGRAEEAAKALADFRRAYPGYALPDDLP